MDTLQRQLINLQKLLLAQNNKPVAAAINVNTDTAAADTVIGDIDSTGTDSVAVDTISKIPSTSVVDSSLAGAPIQDTAPKPEYITDKELGKLKEDLAKTQKVVDSLKEVKPAMPKQVVPEEEVAPVEKTFFETSGKVEVFFDVSSSALNPESRKKLDDMIEYAKNHPEAKFLLKGFTDKTGSLAVNKVLSDKRANAVQAYITSKGISSERLQVMSIGPDQSLTGGSQSYGRRVEVILN